MGGRNVRTPVLGSDENRSDWYQPPHRVPKIVRTGAKIPKNPQKSPKKSYVVVQLRLSYNVLEGYQQVDTQEQYHSFLSTAATIHASGQFVRVCPTYSSPLPV